MKLANVLLFCVNVALGLMLIVVISRYGIADPPQGWRYTDLVLVVLVAVSVVLAALTIFLAALAIWGYAQLRHDARVQAAETAREQAARTAREEVPGIAKPEARRQAQAWLEGVEPRTEDLTRALSGDEDGGDAGR